MGVQRVQTGDIAATASVIAYPRLAPSALAEVPGGLYPLRARAFIIDEYRIMAGWPVSVPAYDVTGDGLVTLTGQVLSFRPDPASVTTNAQLRWVASNGYDEDSLTWKPVQYGFAPIDITMATDHVPPLITDYQYRVRNERFRMTALHFDSTQQQYLSLDMSSQISGQGITVIMVLSPNNPKTSYAGLFTNQDAYHYTDALVQGQYVYIASESQSTQRAAPISSALNSNAPLYLAIILDRPNTVTYSGQGPSSVQTVSSPAGITGVPIHAQWYIGRDRGTAYLDMALFDIGVYPARLTMDQVQTEFSILSQVYGGDS